MGGVPLFLFLGLRNLFRNLESKYLKKDYSIAFVTLESQTYPRTGHTILHLTL